MNEDRLGDDDSPVEMYQLDYDSEDPERFTRGGLYSQRITSFVLTHISSFLHGRGGGCRVKIQPTASLLEDFRRSFPVRTSLDDLLIIEKPDVIALFPPDTPRSEGSPLSHLSVEIWKPFPWKDLPSSVIDQSGPGGAFHGMPVPQPGR